MTTLTNAEQRKFDGMAAKAIQLSKLAPLLTEAAHQLEREARQQQGTSSTISDGAAQLTQELTKTLLLLREASDELIQSVQVIRRIADQTKMLALNASIQAASVGEKGRGFAVVAEAVKELSDQTMTATVEINDKLGEMSRRVQETTRFTGAQDARQAAVNKTDFNLSTLNTEIAKITGVATTQSQSSAHLARISDNLNSLAEALLLSLGSFRMSAHEQCRTVLEHLVEEPGIQSFQRPHMEAALRASLRRNAWIELFYVTDAAGIQITSNIGSSEDTSAFGKNWSGRPWFQSPLRSKQIETSDLYRSSATNDFCFTVSAPLLSPEGRVKGILAADVNFSRMVEVR